MFDLKGKRVLLTGASGGIGGAIARAFDERGASLVLSGTRRDTLERHAAELSRPAQIVPCDLSDSNAVEALFPAAENEGPVDILINNAGLTRDMLALRLRNEDWQKVIQVNLTATFLLSRAALKSMTRRRQGRIITITSIVGHTGNPGQANYCAAKAGLTGMTKALAQEVASRNITVNCVAPGFIVSAMTESLDERLKEKLLGAIPAGRMGEGKDVAAAVVFLASDEAGYITGETIQVNGGMAMI
ncbi:MAG TPA: 3-oxoacyl-[acyl-carrier-protein] reductase [Dongiaceae bacterium]|jgi:3-oxoacyl-[acyl-carrier protein] reductase|nr:3-oxoacyl-[acyl-carrier-protein] reductase [Dongiaceae bacterium]